VFLEFPPYFFDIYIEMVLHVTPLMREKIHGAAVNIQTRSMMGQNLIIDPSRGLRVGRKVLLGTDAIPESINSSRRGFCIALRGQTDVEGLICRIASDSDLLGGKERHREYDGTSVTSDFKRVVLVSPYFERNGGYVMPPMGIERIAAYLRSVNPAVDVETVDPTLEGGSKSFSRLMTGRRPDIIGFSSITQTLKNDIDLLAALSSRFMDSGRPITLMGNSGVMIGADKLLKAIPPLDAVVVGPGEFVLSSILSAVQLGEHDRDGIINTLDHVAEDPAQMVTRSSGSTDLAYFPSVSTAHLSILQRATDHFFIPHEEYWQANGTLGDISLHISTVSCPRGCLYCAAPKGRLGFLSVEDVVGMFEDARRAYPMSPEFVFTDDNLFSVKSYAEKLMKALRASPLWNEDLRFSAYARADSFKKERDNDFLDDIRATGFTGIVVGAEAFSRQLEQLNKGVSAERTKETISLLDRKGFDIEMDIILLPPNSTLGDLFSTMERSIELARSGNVQVAISPLLLAFSGAPLTEKKVSGGSVAVTERPNVKVSLEQEWIKKVEIEYDRAYGLDIPRRFKLIRPILQSLLDGAIDSANKAYTKLRRSLGEGIGDQNLPNMMLFWALAAIVEKNARDFTEDTAGEGAVTSASDASRLKELIESEISSKCGMCGREVIELLRDLQKKLPRLR